MDLTLMASRWRRNLNRDSGVASEDRERASTWCNCTEKVEVEDSAAASSSSSEVNDVWNSWWAAEEREWGGLGRELRANV